MRRRIRRELGLEEGELSDDEGQGVRLARKAAPAAQPLENLAEAAAAGVRNITNFF